MIGELFDPKSEYWIEETCRPHWSQSGAVVFVTFRTADSIPKEILQLWEREKQDWLVRRGYGKGHWSTMLDQLDEQDRNDFNREFNRKKETCLDECHGRCVLRGSEQSRIVAETLLHFDKDRYRMGEFIVMPNHAPLLCAFASADQMREQFDSWQHYSAVQINRSIGSKGKFWQGDPFDHLVRSPEQYEYFRRYIADNPRKARLPESDYYLRQT